MIQKVSEVVTSTVWLSQYTAAETCTTHLSLFCAQVFTSSTKKAHPASSNALLEGLEKRHSIPWIIFPYKIYIVHMNNRRDHECFAIPNQSTHTRSCFCADPYQNVFGALHLFVKLDISLLFSIHPINSDMKLLWIEST